MVGNALITRLRQAGLRALGTTRRKDPAGGDCLHLDLSEDMRLWRPPQPVDVAILCAGEIRIQAAKTTRWKARRSMWRAFHNSP